MKVTDVSITIPEDKYKVISNNDNDSYELINSVPYPTSATGGIYNEKYFQSVAEYLKLNAIPGSKTGHGNENVDFYTVGMLLEPDKASPGQGVAHFRIHIPSTGYDGIENSNSSFIRACKAGTIEFSIVATVSEDNRDPVTGEYIFSEDYGRPRLDAVGEGAMPQIIHANQKQKALEKQIIELVEKGLVDYDTAPPRAPCEAIKWPIIQNGKVMKKALSARQFMGEIEDRPFAIKMLKMIHKLRNTTNSTKPVLKISLNNAIEQAVVTQENPPKQPDFDNLMTSYYGKDYLGWVGSKGAYEVININNTLQKVLVENDKVIEV